jgi:methyl-accepting chemotaxis protein
MFNRSKLASKILAPILGLALVLILVATGALWLQRKVADINRQGANASAQAIEASEVRALSRAIQRDALKLTMDNWSADRNRLADSISSRGKELLARAHGLSEMVDPNDTEMSHNFVGLQENVVKEIDTVKDAVAADRIAEAKEAFKQRVEPAEKAASKLTDAFIERIEKSVKDLSAEASDVQFSAQLTLLSASLLCVLVGLSVSIIVASRGVILPLRRIVAAMAGLSGGDYQSSIDGVERSDEIGDMARSVSVFRDNAIERRRLETDAAANRAAAEAERERTDAERRQNEAEQTAVVGTLADNLVKIAKGDLTTRIDAGFKGRYQQIKTDFNAAIAKLEETIQSVIGSTSAIHSGTQEISAASDDLSRRTEQQAASLEETAAALEQITTTVKKSAEGATHARQVVAAADDDAKKSAVVVRQAVEAMDAIAKSAQQISQIIGVIDEIAFQTNLLALNAGVEAARAGDAGRGFAVVASEVRALAQRSAEAAKEIKGLISASTTQVDHGVKLVAETGQSLERIMAQVTEINSVVSEIAAGAQEQATGLQQINIAIGQMDQVTQQNASMVEESTAASHSLSEETDQLSDLIAHFHVDRATGDDALRSQLENAAPHAFRQPAKAPAGSRTEPRVAASNPRPQERKTAARPVGAASKAVANGAAVGDDSGAWEEF